MRVLRRVLGDLEIGVEHCTDADAAARRLSRQRFEAVIVDCHDEKVAGQVLKSVRSAPCNKHAIAVAIIDGQKAVRGAFALGAHFVLYEPLSSERAKASFRAARALMKCERRHNTRVPVEIPVTVILTSGSLNATTSDLSEGGMAVQQRVRAAGPMRLKFTLPGTGHILESAAHVAWENNGQSGMRFIDLSPEPQAHLKAWLAQHSPEIEADDPPVPCKLTDLSLGGCYLEMPVPFPARTKVLLAMRVSELRVEVQGIVRVTHAETGMGVEFNRATDPQCQQVERFIHALMNTNGATPELAVSPEGMENSEPRTPAPTSAPLDADDPLLGLFHRKTPLTTESFLSELRKQRNPSPDAAQASV